MHSCSRGTFSRRSNSMESLDFHQIKTATWTQRGLWMNIGLICFLAGTSTAARIMVRPEKLNHPEYDGLCIHTIQQGERELVAWNASDAVNHTGSASELCLLLQEIANRSPDDHPLIFDRARFVFIVPTKTLEPSNFQVILHSFGAQPTDGDGAFFRF